MTASISEVESYLHTHIPLSREMGMRVRSVGEDGVRLAAPIEPNINHRGTVFGGSISALAILSAWTLVHLHLRAEGIPNHIVIQRNSVEYLRPVDGEFEALCAVPRADDWRRFVDALRRRGRGRITLTATVYWGSEVVGSFEGAFVATRAEDGHGS